MQKENSTQNPLLEENQGNRNQNVERFALCTTSDCAEAGSTAIMVFSSVVSGAIIWLLATHPPQLDDTRRLTENDNIDSLPLLSISLLGLAAGIASTKTQSIQNFSLGSIFNKKTGEPENDSKDLEEGTQQSPHNA